MKLIHTNAFLAGAARRCVAATLAVTLGLGSAFIVPVPAFATETDDLQAQVEEAQERLGSLTHQLEEAQAQVDATALELEETQARIAELEDEIAANQEELAAAQSELADHVADSYKTGGISLVTILLSSDSFNDLTSQLYYAGRVADAESNQISNVRDLQAELESQQTELTDREAELTTLLDEQTQSQEEMEAATAEANSYLNGLSDELQAALEAERQAAAEEERRRAEEAARQAQEELERQQQEEEQQQQQQGQQGSSSGNETVEVPSGGGSGGLTAAQRQTIVNAGMSQIGVDYALGAYQPGVLLDCSGLTTYAYAQAGISIIHQSGRQFNTVVAAGNLKTSMSDLEPGDLVFYGRPNISHVAIYIGGGRIVHANGYGRGVMTSRVGYNSNFRGGGSPI